MVRPKTSENGRFGLTPTLPDFAQNKLGEMSKTKSRDESVRVEIGRVVSEDQADSIESKMTKTFLMRITLVSIMATVLMMTRVGLPKSGARTLLPSEAVDHQQVLAGRLAVKAEPSQIQNGRRMIAPEM